MNYPLTIIKLLYCICSLICYYIFNLFLVISVVHACNNHMVTRFCLLATFRLGIQECNIEEVAEEEETSSKSSKDKKSNGPSSEKAPSLVFKITSRVPYKTVLKGIRNYLFNFFLFHRYVTFPFNCTALHCNDN